MQAKSICIAYKLILSILTLWVDESDNTREDVP